MIYKPKYANDLLCASIKKAFPLVNVIGEEGPVDLKAIKPDMLVEGQDESVIKHYSEKLPENVTKAIFEDITVWIDPLDGTKEFTEGFLDHVTVLVGIAIGKDAIGGVIHQPFWNYQSHDEDKILGRTFHGIVGAGVGGTGAAVEADVGEVVVVVVDVVVEVEEVVAVVVGVVVDVVVVVAVVEVFASGPGVVIGVVSVVGTVVVVVAAVVVLSELGTSVIEAEDEGKVEESVRLESSFPSPGAGVTEE